MSVAKITETYLDDIADAIRFKRMSEDTYTPPEMADAIMAIQGGPNAVAVVNSVDPDTGGLIKTIVGTDISSDTVTSGSLLKGYTAHMADGTFIEGEYQGGAGDVTQDENGYIILGKDGSDEPSGAISVVDTIDPVSGGTIRSINAVNISNDTVTAATLLSGYTAHDAAGDAVVGTYEGAYTNDDFADLSKPIGEVTTTLTSLPPYFFYQRTGITKFTGNNVTSLSSASYAYCHTFYGCTALQEVVLPNVTVLYDKNSVFRGCTSLRKVTLSKVATLNGSSVFNGCSSLEGIVFPSAFSVAGNAGTTLGSGMFSGCTSLAYFDSAMVYNIQANTFNNCASLSVIVIRYSPNTNAGNISTLANITAFDGTPFASGGTGGTLYVPSAKIASYQAATNWSTILGYATNQIKAIEGSYYETHWADGTVISS